MARLKNSVLVVVSALVPFQAVANPREGFKSARTEANATSFQMAPMAKTATIAPHAMLAGVTAQTLKQYSSAVQTSTGISWVVKGLFVPNPSASTRIHFINTNKFKYHYEFATQVLGYKKPTEVFNLNYTVPGPQREYVAFSLVMPSQDKANGGKAFLLELWSGDNLEGATLRSLMSELSKEIPAGTPLLFHPLSREQELVAAGGIDRSQFVLTTELLGNRTYLALREGTAVGYVKILDGDEASVQNALVDLTNIVVYKRVPNDIGLIGGVVTEEMQTPLSHVNVKSMGRKTVNMYMKDATEVLRKYEGKPVKLVATANEYKIEELSPAEADQQIAAFWKERKPKQNVELRSMNDPQYDAQFVRLQGFYKKVPKKAEHSELIQRVGAKAANLALLDIFIRRMKMPNVSTPPAIGVPFNFYDKFIDLKQVGLDEMNPAREMTPRERTIEILNAAALLNPDIIHPIEKVRPALEQVRAMLQKARVPQETLELFRKLIFEDATSPIHIANKVPRIRLRSSTNSEDLDGFTGAGLYESDGIDLYDKTASKFYDLSRPYQWDQPLSGDKKKVTIKTELQKVIPYLYASIWNERAFLEREWFNMNGMKHLDVKAGLAVHNAFPLRDFESDPGEVANGVAVTSNIYAPEDESKIYLNAQHFDLSVTNPPVAKDLTKVGEDPAKPYTTEEILVTTFTADDVLNNDVNAWQRWPVERIRKTSVRNGQIVLNSHEDDPAKRDDVRELAHALWAINKQMAYVYGKSADQFAIDSEWKLYGKDRKIIIKQVRPFVPPSH